MTIIEIIVALFSKIPVIALHYSTNAETTCNIIREHFNNLVFEDLITILNFICKRNAWRYIAVAYAEAIVALKVMMTLY